MSVGVITLGKLKKKKQPDLKTLTLNYWFQLDLSGSEYV